MKSRLAKVIAEAGVASRRAAEQLIILGHVKVNGVVVGHPAPLVDPFKDKISVQGQLLKRPEEKVYFLLNKPVGYLCTAVRPLPNSKIVIDLFAKCAHRLFTVGRLDKETTGLLLVTNDGTFAHKVIHPSAGNSKEYLAKVRQEITAEHLKKISEGLYIEGSFVKPLKVSKIRRGTLKIILGEGKKHEVRLLVGQAGLEILELSRIRLGPLLLGTLPIGSYRPLSPAEIKSLTPNSSKTSPVST